MESERLISAFSALSEPTRLRIVMFLSDRQRGAEFRDGISEEEICFHIADSSSKFFSITHHLYELEAAGLITIGRKDNLLICSLRAYMFEALAAELVAIGA
jgi:DNA-binding transcriptional ArsR family regulator